MVVDWVMGVTRTTAVRTATIAQGCWKSNSHPLRDLSQAVQRWDRYQLVVCTPRTYQSVSSGRGCVTPRACLLANATDTIRSRDIHPNVARPGQSELDLRRTFQKPQTESTNASRKTMSCCAGWLSVIGTWTTAEGSAVPFWDSCFGSTGVQLGL